MNDAERFWAKVDKSGECWEWTAKVIANTGYGRIKINRKMVLSHRYSYILHHPLTIDLWKHREICVCHKCDNRKCVNPAHLFLGSRGDNWRDCIDKGRNPDRKGEKHPMVKLTEDDVREIRTRYAEGGITQEDLGIKYGVERTTIRDIIRRLNWKHI